MIKWWKGEGFLQVFVTHSSHTVPYSNRCQALATHPYEDTLRLAHSDWNRCTLSIQPCLPLRSFYCKPGRNSELRPSNKQFIFFIFFPESLSGSQNLLSCFRFVGLTESDWNVQMKHKHPTCTKHRQQIQQYLWFGLLYWNTYIYLNKRNNNPTHSIKFRNDHIASVKNSIPCK